jgi:aryl-alcohol dehydrogenase-like predicted oxidoreductase
MIEKRRLGRTELMVSCLSFGSLGILDRYMLRWGTDAGPDVARRIFEMVLDGGINLVDTKIAKKDWGRP